MDFNIEKRPKPKAKDYLKEDVDLAYAFAKRIYAELKQVVKGLVLFGATARAQPHKGGDVDVLIVLDDVSINLTPAIVHTYRIITQKIVNEVSNRIHVTTLKYTTFFEYARVGDPVAVNILRDGVALIDTGFFDPMQLLLFQGRIRPTRESVWGYYNRTGAAISSAKWHVMQSVIDLYWSVVDAAQAALMSRGVIPPSPEHVADHLESTFLKNKTIHPRHVKVMRHFYRISKMISHREIKEITGAEFDNYLKEATDFVREMHKIIKSEENMSTSVDMDRPAAPPAEPSEPVPPQGFPSPSDN
ncbi:MAG: nucleotidyltransferase domain-containing protein [archaeon]